MLERSEESKLYFPYYDLGKPLDSNREIFLPVTVICGYFCNRRNIINCQKLHYYEKHE